MTDVLIDLLVVVLFLAAVVGFVYWLTGEDSKRRHGAWWAARPSLKDPCAHLRR